jgi:MarR family transcriptional regulator, 2-MHQ and catechol-resistance regulon repressor
MNAAALAENRRAPTVTDLEKSGLGDSDFRVLEVLLHKGPLPVNVIGPKVNLTPGSISVAVERLVAKGLVSRIECSEDRRVRFVDLLRNQISQN